MDIKWDREEVPLDIDRINHMAEDCAKRVLNGEVSYIFSTCGERMIVAVARYGGGVEVYDCVVVKTAIVEKK